MKSIPREVRVINARVINSGLITHKVVVELVVGNHREEFVVDVTNTRRYAFVLGIPWLVKHNLLIRWTRAKLTLDSQYCRERCFRTSVQTVKGQSSIPDYNCSSLAVEAHYSDSPSDKLRVIEGHQLIHE